MSAPSATTSTTRGRPHLGPRVVVTAALWPALEHLVDDVRGPLDRSPFLADLLASHVDRPDLIRHQQLALSLTSHDGMPGRPRGATRHCTVRVHPAVAGELVAHAERAGLPRAVYNAMAIANILVSCGAETTAKQEGLPLAM